jgi:hypothetical protein
MYVEGELRCLKSIVLWLNKANHLIFILPMPDEHEHFNCIGGVHIPNRAFVSTAHKVLDARASIQTCPLECDDKSASSSYIMYMYIRYRHFG